MNADRAHIPGPNPKPLCERILASVEVDDAGCWVWQKGKYPTGYGVMGVGSNLTGGIKLRPAHRISYQTFVGPIPEGLDIDHLCRVRACVNPAHLEPVTRRENLRRGAGIGGVLFTGDPTANLRARSAS